MDLQSESIKEITTALSKAQMEMEPAKKTQKNPFFNSKYAGLEDVIEAVRGPFSRNGLAFFQGTLPSDQGVIIIVTTISHISGEWVRGYLPIKPTKNDPQGLGSAITYGKRYGLQALSGQPSEDDDGNKASEKRDAKVQNMRDTVLGLLKEKNLSNSEIKTFLSHTIKNYKDFKSLNIKELTDIAGNFDGYFNSFLDSVGKKNN